MMARLSSLVVLCALASLAELSLATKDAECNLECALARLTDLEQKQRENEADKMELREIIAAQKSTILDQASRISKLEKAVADLKQEIKETKDNHISNSHDLRINVNSLQPRSEHRRAGSVIKSHTRRQESVGIAFSTYLDHDVDLPGLHNTIKCNRIILNEGSTYNNYTGVFTCSEDGVYLLTFSIGEKNNQELRVYMVKNQQNLVDANADSLHTTQELQGGNTAIVRLSAGDAVWLETAESHSHNFVEGNTGLRLTTFSGVYLYP